MTNHQVLDQKKLIHETSWEPGYQYFSTVINAHKFMCGAEVGVAFGGHCEFILANTKVQTLYGVDDYRHRPNYNDPMNLPQMDFDALYKRTVDRLAKHDDRFILIREDSVTAAKHIKKDLDFVYLDADHSYQGVGKDLSSWFPKIRDGGIVGGHDYGHPDFPGVKQAVDEFFRRFGWKINTEGEGVWWVKKEIIYVSFFIPAYNCETTIEESVSSIYRGNFSEGDEVVIVNDFSVDNTQEVLAQLQIKFPCIQILNHLRNRGGGATRNTAVEHAKHHLLFCLDSDNVLADDSVKNLKKHLVESSVDVAAFEEVRYFESEKNETTHTWKFRRGITTLSEYLSTIKVPGASGNYMFTRESWQRAGEYPASVGALDTWGFGLRQVATGSKMSVLPDSYYYHRFGHESYWARDTKDGGEALKALQVLLPFVGFLEEQDVDYIFSKKGRRSWFINLDKRPLRLQSKASRIRNKNSLRSALSTIKKRMH